MSPLTSCLLFSALLFAIGFAGAVTRRNAIVVLMGIELMLNAANVNFVAFWRFRAEGAGVDGITFVLFAIGIAAAEAAVGLALVIAVYRHYQTAKVNAMTELKG